MIAKFFLYLTITPLVFIGLDAININGIFKKNKIIQTYLFYFFLCLSFSYLVTNFLYDLYLTSIFS
ncbi:MAG: DUF1146 domain-containing protein [Tenericutes bacterium]|jgi:uncharacterized membrane protein YwzB|nr:DUF1146 domain-containing protein [Mycoplasmatota bacterium]